MIKRLLILLTIILFSCESKITSEEVETAKKENNIVLVDFYTEGCPPCRKISPIIDEIAEDYPEITVLKLDMNSEEGLHSKYETVNKVPTVIIYYKNRPYATFIGYHDKETYIKPIETLIKYDINKKGT